MPTLRRIFVRNLYLAIFLLVLLLSLTLRVYNLNYNSPFKDEAVYIVVGKLHTFQKDFWSYNASAWMGGSPFFYPPLTALAYISGGILGSRLLNVIFGVLAVEVIFHLSIIISRNSKFKFLAGILAAATLGGATSSLYISRLATYDMPSFYFLILGIFLLVLAEQSQNTGKWYFLASVFLLLSFLIKIIVILYLPFIIIYSLFRAKSLAGKLFFWKRYFMLPLIAGLVIYLLTTKDSLISFFTLQAGREKVSFFEVWQTYWDNTSLLWLLWSLGSVGLLISKQWKKWAILTFASLIILLVHLITFRQISLDKHVFLSVIFLSLVAGVGISELINFLAKKFPTWTYLLYGCLISLLIFFWSVSYYNLKDFNLIWPDSSQVLSFLNKEVHSQDKILAQSGADVILALYDKNFPTNTATFDFFVYGNYLGERAYTQAVQDGYFNFIELYQNPNFASPDELQLASKVVQNMADNYRLTFTNNGFLIYQRNF